MDRAACCSLSVLGKLMFCSPSRSSVDPGQASRSMVVTPRLGHGLRCTWAPPSGTGLCAWVVRTWAFRSTDCSQMMEPRVCGSAESGGRPCASPVGLLASRCCTGFWLIFRVFALGTQRTYRQAFKLLIRNQIDAHLVLS